jgi:hypothetical protein
MINADGLNFRPKDRTMTLEISRRELGKHTAASSVRARSKRSRLIPLNIYELARARSGVAENSLYGLLPVLLTRS